LYRSSTRGPEDDSVESKHVAPLQHYMFNFTTVMFDGTSPTFYVCVCVCINLHRREEYSGVCSSTSKFHKNNL